MKIRAKLEQIRQQPEHVRMRWVWGCVSVSMLIIVSIWIFYMTTLFASDNKAPQATDSVSNLKDQLSNLKNQAPSLKDTTKPVTVGNEGIVDPTQNSANDFQYPTTNDSAAVQSSTYTDLPSADTTQPTN